MGIPPLGSLKPRPRSKLGKVPPILLRLPDLKPRPTLPLINLTSAVAMLVITSLSLDEVV